MAVCINDEVSPLSPHTELPDCILDKAFDLAKDALLCEEVPVACVIFRGSTVLAAGRNEVNESMNASRHAEIVAIDKLIVVANKERITLQNLTKSCVVYITVEPCVMCSVALREVGLTDIRFGCRNYRFGGCGSIISAHCKHLRVGCQPTLYDDGEANYEELDSLEIEEGIRSNEAVELLKAFYKGENPKLNPDENV